MSERYESWRSVDKITHVICRDGGFDDEVPQAVRKKGPWSGAGRGEILDLKPEIRLALAKDAYILIVCEIKDFRETILNG